VISQVKTEWGPAVDDGRQFPVPFDPGISGRFQLGENLGD
jgi:hypothetical protein